jgi:hypothetical protein
VSSAGAGGTTSSGGSVMATDGGAGGIVTASGGTSSSDSGVAGAAGAGGADGGAGGLGTGGAAGSGGAGGAPGGAWARCMTDADCTGGRVCTEAAQSVVVTGRPGGCVHRCTFGTSTCDPPLQAGTVTCTSLLVTSFCTISCPNSAPCPTGMDCVLGSCFYTK